MKRIFLFVIIALFLNQLCSADTMETYYKVEYRGYTKQYAAQMDNVATIDLILYIELNPGKRTELLRTILEATIKAKNPIGDVLATIWTSDESRKLPLTNNAQSLKYDYKTKKIELYQY